MIEFFDVDACASRQVSAAEADLALYAVETAHEFDEVRFAIKMRAGAPEVVFSAKKGRWRGKVARRPFGRGPVTVEFLRCAEGIALACLKAKHEHDTREVAA